MEVVDLLLFIVFQMLFVFPLRKLVLDLLKVKLGSAATLVFGLIVGIVVLTMSILTIGYIGLYNLFPLPLIIPPVILLFQLKTMSIGDLGPKRIINKQNLFLGVVLTAFTLTLSAIVLPNGVTAQGELALKSVFVEDGMWHVAIINNLSKAIPPENPLLSGERLVGYNYFADVYISTIYKLTRIDILILYFRLIGPFLALLSAASLFFVFIK